MCSVFWSSFVPCTPYTYNTVYTLQCVFYASHFTFYIRFDSIRWQILWNSNNKMNVQAMNLYKYIYPYVGKDIHLCVRCVSYAMNQGYLRIFYRIGINDDQKGQNINILPFQHVTEYFWFVHFSPFVFISFHFIHLFPFCLIHFSQYYLTFYWCECGCVLSTDGNN